MASELAVKAELQRGVGTVERVKSGTKNQGRFRGSQAPPSMRLM